ncbi:MAG: Rpn family recombination-promoting nuclease/putative transposase [Erysipelotrichales bacterium]|nr:Rpn family recombination-promoting nuclease/putative transposase [Erysipelotrichales bacterium]
MGNKDLSMKSYLKNNDRFADFVNVVLFNGEKIVSANSLVDVSTEKINQLTSSDPKFHSVQRDVLKQGVFKSNGEQIYCLFGIENQVTIDYAMPIRVMEYDVLSYKEQLRNNEAMVATKLECLENMSRKSRLMPIITIVFNLSKDNWNGPRTLHEMLITSNENILKYIPEYKLNLVSPHEMTDEEIEKFETSVRYLIECRKYAENKVKLKEIMDNNEIYSKLDRETAEVINLHMNMKLKYEENEEEINMCKAIDDMREDSRQEMLQKNIESMHINGFTIVAIAESLGEEIDKVAEVISAYRTKYGDNITKTCKALQDMKLEGIEVTLLNSIKNLVHKLSLSVEDAMRTLDIPEDKWDYYLDKLNQELL